MYWLIKMETIENADNTHCFRKPGSVAAVGLARILAGPGFDLQYPRNLRGCGSNNLNTPLEYHPRPNSRFRLQANPNPRYLPH